MTGIIDKNRPHNSEYSQYNDKLLDNLDKDRGHYTPTHLYNPTHPTHPTQTDNKQALGFILTHFETMDFPRKISTRTTEGRQIQVNDKPQALARFKQANWLDCRISAYTELDDSPNFLFIDIDTLDLAILRQVLERCAKFGFHPTVLFTGSGYHVYQPVHSVRLHEVNDFAKFGNKEELANRFLRVAESYISSGRKDPNHNPSLKSCMVRIPGSINSKNGQEVRIIQKWDGKRPCIAPLLGIFYSTLATKQRKYEAWLGNQKSSCQDNRITNNRIDWIESLLKTPLYDYRKGIVNLVLAPYFVNIRHIDCAIGAAQIKRWLEICAIKRKLNFYPDPTINAALHTAQKSGYKPMRLDTLKKRNPTIYEELKLR